MLLLVQHICLAFRQKSDLEGTTIKFKESYDNKVKMYILTQYTNEEV